MRGAQPPATKEKKPKKCPGEDFSAKRAQADKKPSHPLSLGKFFFFSRHNILCLLGGEDGNWHFDIDQFFQILLRKFCPIFFAFF